MDDGMRYGRILLLTDSHEAVRKCAEEATRRGVRNIITAGGCDHIFALRELLPDLDAAYVRWHEALKAAARGGIGNPDEVRR